MDDTQIAVPQAKAPQGSPAPVSAAKEGAFPRDSRGGHRGGMRGGHRGGMKRERRGGRAERARPEFDQKIVSIRRVTRVVAGGRRFNFSVAIVIGDHKGSVAVGTGKAGDTSLAIDKAVRDAKKHLLKVSLTKHNSIAHDVYAKYASSVVELRPAPRRGLVAGSSVRTVLELGGITNLTGKLLSRSKNKLNNARATIEALKQLAPRAAAAQK